MGSIAAAESAATITTTANPFEALRPSRLRKLGSLILFSCQWKISMSEPTEKYKENPRLSDGECAR
jgi:hypothetical protein